ncbi:hypothetical protein ACJJIG_10660 [Microbulbifer sp. SSSA007]|uniref:hypothetical protein n=1 Tax=Microbulbifer sp. SSSA007 TaxID=3243379 RepID=UPI00403998F4
MSKKKSLGTAGSSARLHRLLDAKGFAPDGKGRVAAFSREFRVNTANATRWLNDDKVPRDMTELKRISDALGTDPFWWAIGKGEEESSVQEVFDISLFSRCANALLKRLADLMDRPLDLEGEALNCGYIELYEYACSNSGNIDPDRVSLTAVNVLAVHRKQLSAQ